MNSMTGFGKAEVTTKVGRFVVEISSVNSRFLEFTVRLPRQFSLFEYRLRELVGQAVNRGKITIYLGFEESEKAPGRFLLSENILRSYHRQLLALKKSLNLSGEVGVRELLMLPDIVKQDETTVPDEMVWEGVKKATLKALNELVRMRRREGKALAQDMKQRLGVIKALISKIEKESSHVVEKYRQKLSARVSELVDSSIIYDPGRLEQEIAIYAEKSDITEECTRFYSHISQYRRSFQSKEPVGKRLNFILQEMNREINTIASKCAEINVLSTVIAVKEEVEKLREQIQNVE